MVLDSFRLVVRESGEWKFRNFYQAWTPLFDKHRVKLVTVHDGDAVVVRSGSSEKTPAEVLGEDADLILNRTAGCRNLGFAYVAKYLPQIEVVVTLDDDLEPLGDPIRGHLDILGQRRSVSWMQTIDDVYTRGFPYAVRDEAEVVISHGVWQNVLDIDAPTQLMDVYPSGTYPFPRMVIPKGCLAPLSGMNLGFSRKALPYVFFAPQNMEHWGLDRMEDIWGLVDAKRECDRDGYAVVTGYSEVWHTRASDVFANIIKEAKGLRLNETYWQGDVRDPYFAWYRDARARWQA